MPTVTSIVVNVLPVILVVGVWLFFMGRIKKTGTPALDAQRAFMTEHLEEMRRLNRTLERVAAALEAKGEAGTN